MPLSRIFQSYNQADADKPTAHEAGQVTVSPAVNVGTLSDTFLFASASCPSAGVVRLQFEDALFTVVAAQCSLQNTGSQAFELVYSGSASNATGVYADFMLRALSGSAALGAGNVATLARPSNEVTCHLHLDLKSTVSR